MNQQNDVRIFVYNGQVVLFSFHEIVDLVPINSVHLDAFLPMLDTLERTFWIWRLSVKEALIEASK